MGRYDYVTSVHSTKNGKRYVVFNIPCRINHSVEGGEEVTAEDTMLVIRLLELAEEGVIRSDVNFRFFDENMDEIFGE